LEVICCAITQNAYLRFVEYGWMVERNRLLPCEAIKYNRPSYGAIDYRHTWNIFAPMLIEQEFPSSQ